MIRAAELFGAATFLWDDGGSVMAADVEEGAKLAIVAANDDERLFVDVDGEELTGLADLIEAADDLPIGGEDAAAFELMDAAIEIPGSGNGESALEGIGRIVEVEDVADRGLVHAVKTPVRGEMKKGWCGREDLNLHDLSATRS